MKILLISLLVGFGSYAMADEQVGEMSLAHCKRVVQAKPIPSPREPSSMPGAVPSKNIDLMIQKVNASVLKTQSECREKYGDELNR